MTGPPIDTIPESEVIDSALASVRRELYRTMAKFGPIRNTHEGYAVILEEVDEFWSGVKTKGTTDDELRGELVQVAAMAVRTMLDCLEQN